MKIAVIGTGNVGSVLGTRWAQHGHQVVFGSRDPEGESAQQVVAAGGANACAASAAEAAAASDVVVLATPWSATEETVKTAGDLAGKVLVDCTNPLAPNLSGLTVGHDTSGAEQIAAWAPGAHVVKAFNSTGAGNMADPAYPGGPVSLFICGDDTDAKEKVTTLAEDLGFDVIDTGGLAMARYLEPLAMLAIKLMYVQGYGPDVALNLVKRSG